jgi:hypothetical protein
VADGVGDLLEAFIAQHVSQNRSAREISRLLRREMGSAWGNRSVHEIKKRDVIEVVSAIEHRGVPIAANKALKTINTRHSCDGAWGELCWINPLLTGSHCPPRKQPETEYSMMMSLLG